jgi:hypothetical protein
VEQILKTRKLIAMSSWLLFIIILLLAIIIILLVIIVRTRAFVKKQNNALNMMSEIVTFDTILLHCLAGLAEGSNQKQKEERMKRILRDLLKNAMSSQAAGGHVIRASVLLPDSTDPQYLKIWGYHEMPPTNIQRTKFYIAHGSVKR